MEFLAWIFIELLVLVAILVLWLLSLPIAIFIALHIIFIIATVQRKPVKPLIIRFIEWWTDFIPSRSYR